MGIVRLQEYDDPFKEGDCDLWAEVLAIYRSNLQKNNNREKTGMQVRVGYA